ncbi:MAG: hypothetical protein K0R13_3429 [Propionibacteriaceae bacterium]|nr:hypothetical protein [Propionibacteriaceae bacterium]
MQATVSLGKVDRTGSYLPGCVSARAAVVLHAAGR